MRQGVALGLSCLLTISPAFADPGPGFAAGPASNAPSGISSSLPDAPLPETQGLTITILEGEGALNNIRQRTAREPIVQVEDKNHKPVAGALVLFAINDGSGGAGATVNGLTSLSVRTGADGRAQMQGLKPNNTAGEYTIVVTATVGILVATAIIHQRNEAGGAAESKPVKASHSLLFKGTLIGGAALAGVLIGVLLTRGGNSGQITAGQPTVGAP